MQPALLLTILSFALTPVAALANDQSAVGDWSGSLHAPDGTYRVRLHVQAVADGGVVGTLSGMPLAGSTPMAAHVEKIDQTLSFGTSLGQYKGDWNASRSEWVGTWNKQI